MATMKYFSGTTELVSIQPLDNSKFVAQFGNVACRRWDGYSRMVGKTVGGDLLPVTRAITYKSNPSLHKCDARCRNAKGGNCECSCGGQYHGAGN